MLPQKFQAEQWRIVQKSERLALMQVCLRGPAKGGCILESSGNMFSNSDCSASCNFQS